MSALNYGEFEVDKVLSSNQLAQSNLPLYIWVPINGTLVFMQTWSLADS